MGEKKYKSMCFRDGSVILGFYMVNTAQEKRPVHSEVNTQFNLNWYSTKKALKESTNNDAAESRPRWLKIVRMICRCLLTIWL